MENNQPYQSSYDYCQIVQKNSIYVKLGETTYSSYFFIALSRLFSNFYHYTFL